MRVQGVYVLDMVAHNNDHDATCSRSRRATGRRSLWLAEQAHLANEAWNAGTRAWNREPARRGLRSRPAQPATAARCRRWPRICRCTAKCARPTNPRSTLYNTDGQIFSDAGVPVVLFMENYDINRTGYHDTHDTMANIDLDYGAAVAAIAIESVARAATEKPQA